MQYTINTFLFAGHISLYYTLILLVYFYSLIPNQAVELATQSLNFHTNNLPKNHVYLKKCTKIYNIIFCINFCLHKIQIFLLCTVVPLIRNCPFCTNTVAFAEESLYDVITDRNKRTTKYWLFYGNCYIKYMLSA